MMDNDTASHCSQNTSPVTFTGSLAVPEEAAGAGTAERQIKRFGLVHEALKRGPGIT
jgi:hypothetical protein